MRKKIIQTKSPIVTQPQAMKIKKLSFSYFAPLQFHTGWKVTDSLTLQTS